MMGFNSAKSSGDVRPPVMAGQFYPAEDGTLRRAVTECLEGADVSVAGAPKAVIAPHAGYVYSGPIAGSAFAPLMGQPQIKRVVLLGPSHRVAFRGLALSGASGFATPLGVVPVDTEAVKQLQALPQVRVWEAAHAQEHALEVELPFLQQILDAFKLVPLVVGEASTEEVGEVVDQLWGGAETLLVISSDLSHFYDYDTARALDGQTAQAIECFRPEAIRSEQACGRMPIRGLLWAAGRRGLGAKTLDLRNSGDTAGSRDRVVGYGAFAFGARL